MSERGFASARVRAAAGPARRDARRRRASRARTGGRWCARSQALGRAELERRWESGAPADPRERRHLQRLRRSARHGSPVGARPDPARARLRREWETLRDGARAARAPARRDPRRSLRAAAPAARWPAAGRARLRAPELPARRVTAAAAATRRGSSSTRPTSRARPTASGGCSPTARRRRRARATRSRTGSCSRARCPRRSARAASSAWPASSSGCATRCARSRRSGATNPRIALLTPGPYNETYFEHAYLARYLGFTLVEGGDLTVRDRARLPEDARRARAGRRDPAPRRRRVLRSALAAQRLVARRRGPRARGARGQRRGGERARQRAGRVAGAARVPAGSVPRAARRGARAAVGRDLVVRPGGGARVRRGAPRRARDEAGVSRAPAWSPSSARGSRRASARR